MDLNGPAVEEVDRVGGTLGGFKWRDMGSLYMAENEWVTAVVSS